MKTNKKYTIDRPELSSEEINSMQDFDQVLNGAKGGGGNFFKTKLYIAGSVVVLALLGWGAWSFLNNNEQRVQVEQDKPETTMPRTQEDPEELVRRPLVVPPVKAWDIPFAEYKLDADKGGIIQHETGTRIQIPGQCLLDPDGNRVKGTVTFKYREMHKAAEFALSGIPMTYDSAGTQYYFESAGMCELRAFQDGQELTMDKDKPVQVSMTTTKAGIYNLYQLDEEERNWVAKGATREKSSKAPNRTSNTEDRQPEMESVQIAEDMRTTTAITPELKSIQNEIKDIKKTKPVEPRKPDASRPQIKLEILPEEFPELAGFTEVKFEVAEEDKSFKPEFFKIIWNDIELERYGEGKFQMVLSRVTKDGNETVRLIVYPVFTGQKYETAKKQYDKMLAEYSEKLNKRLAKEAKIKAEMEAERKRQQEEYEKQKALIEERRKKWSERNKEENFGLYTQHQMTREFNMSGFGIWNCDNPALRSASTVNASLNMASNDETLPPNAFHLINDNALMTTPVYRGNSPIKYHSRHSNKILCILPDQRIAYDFSEQWEKGPDKGKVELKVSDKSFKNAKEVLAFIETLE